MLCILYNASRDFEEHVKLIRLLAETRQGLTRLEIIAKGKFPEGGSTSKIL